MQLPRQNKYLLPVVILIVLLAAGLFFFNSARQRAPQNAKTVISAQTLEEQYGLRVNLIAVTAAGGMVDLRLKIVDGEKAKLLLTDVKNFPVLMIGDVILNAPADTKSQKIEFISGGNLFIIYPNSGNAVQRNQPVAIVFGDTALEPISAK